ncbi:MAG: FCD domain-containing protein [Chloroflexota bacterium]|nr:FCD domain-containing protein [Chloroflexota bacterium]
MSVPRAVMAEIQRLFVTGQLHQGDRLPGERELAEQLGVGRSSVRAALQGLQMIGLVNVHHGTGAFLTSELGRWLLEPLKWGHSSRGELFEALIEARLSVEVTLARVAAQRANTEDLERLRAAAERRARAVPGQYLRTGLEFHQAVAQAAHSQVLAFMLAGATHLYTEVLESIERPSELLATFRHKQQAGHVRILVAVEQGNAIAAAEAMQNHILELREFYPQLVLEDAPSSQIGGQFPPHSR